MKQVSTIELDVHAVLVSMVEHVITQWRNDLLVIDKEIIDKNPGRSFIHVTRDHGSHMFFLAEPVLDNSPVPYLFGHSTPLEIRRGEIGLLEDNLCASSSTGAPEVFTFYNGSSLESVTRAQAIEILKQALDKVEREYHRANRRMCA